MKTLFTLLVTAALISNSFAGYWVVDGHAVAPQVPYTDVSGDVTASEIALDAAKGGFQKIDLSGTTLEILSVGNLEPSGALMLSVTPAGGDLLLSFPDAWLSYGLDNLHWGLNEIRLFKNSDGDTVINVLPRAW